MWTATTTTTQIGLRVLASINCGYAINDCIRDNIETDINPFDFFTNDKQKTDKYTF